MRRLPAAALALLFVTSACKKDGREPAAAQPRDTGATAAPVPATSDAGAAPAERAADPGLPPPSEELGAVPEDVAAKVTLEKVASGLDRPVLVTFAPGDPRHRLFVLEQHEARIRVIENGTVAATPYLDLGGTVSTGNEQGLLGLAFHPRFAETGRFWIYLTDRKGDSHVVEYHADPKADAADPTSASELFFADQPYSNHNGGHLAFGSRDNHLYLGLGDGGAAGDPKRNGQNPKSPLAALLRWEVDAKEQSKPVIVAKGLRNPWRYAFDAKTGDLYIGDVGQDLWENVYVVAAGELDGKNFGWNVVEGRHCYEAERCTRDGFTAPVVDYPHDQGCSVTGGVVYRGRAIPALDGVYFYADFCMGWVRSFRWAPDGVRQHWDWRAVLDPKGQLNQIASFGTDEAGEVYLASLDGTIWRIAPR